MSLINQFNGLGGTITSRESLNQIRIQAIQEGNTEIASRIAHLLLSYPEASKFELENDDYIIEPVPDSFLHGLDYEQSPDEPQGLGRVSPTEVYDMITAKIITMIEAANARDYKKTWEAKEYGSGYTIPFNFASKKRYRGVNVLMLTELEPLENPFFLTFKQVKDLKGTVKKGAKGFEVVYFTKIWKTEDKPKNLKFSSYDKTKVESFATENGIQNDLGVIPMLKYYHVYNGSDIEGIDFGLDKFKIGFINLEKPADEANRMPIPEAILKNYPKPQPTLKFGGNRAFYSPGKDLIQMPYLSDFETVQDYYRTLLHEYSHSTGASKRLSRDFSGSQGSKKYAFEELVAELGAIFLSAEAGIVWHNNKNHAAYLKGWNSVLTQIKDDNKFIMKASTAAQKIADYVLQFDTNGDPLYFEDLKVLKAIIDIAKVEKPVKKVASNYGKKTKREPKPKAEKYPFSENDIPYETAYRAYTGISFSPEKRAKMEQKSYFDFMKEVYDENLIIATNNDKLELFKSNFESFQKGYLKRSLDHLRSKHGIFSSMIAGPAKFPVARMEKLNRIANDKLNELIDFGNKAQKRLLQNITPDVDKPIKTGTTGTLKILLEKLGEAEKIHKRNLDGNKLLKKIRSNPKATLQDFIDGFVGIGFDAETAKKEANYMLKYPYAGFFTTNSNAKLKRIKEQIVLEEKLNTIKEKTGNIEYKFNGGTVLLNYEDNKIQIFYNEKPNDVERTKLKKAGNAFKWSPFNKAWQRQLNTYPLRYIKELLPSINMDTATTSKQAKEQKPVVKKTVAELEKANPKPFSIKPKSVAINTAIKDVLSLSKYNDKIKEMAAGFLFGLFSADVENSAELFQEGDKMAFQVLANKESYFYEAENNSHHHNEIVIITLTDLGKEFIQAINSRLESLRNQKNNYALFEGLKVPVTENAEIVFTDVPHEEPEPIEDFDYSKLDPTGNQGKAPTSSKYKTAADRERENQQPKQLYKITGDLSKFLGKIEIKPVQSLAVTLDSEEGGGKTHTFYQWANEFYKAGYKTIIWSLEEHASSGLATDKSKKYFGDDWDKIVVESEISGEAKEETYQRITESINDFDVCFIDSWAKLVELNAKANFDQDFRKKFNGKLFFVIFQRTSSGEMRGGSKGAFDGDVILKVEVDRDDFRNNFIYNHKNRYNDYMPISELKYSPFHQALLKEEEELVFSEEIERI